ncbi:MAG TPA: UDP-2,3-diacylglucosamine diphosphatase [bacterium]|nr:UDP-2,3-diacylglucosamine diphosphatase [bacterium]HPR88658.1 UDP-2,3-diacylglucosamine diphosphatase [bacterium]
MPTLETPVPARAACQTIYLLGDAHLGAQNPGSEAEIFRRFTTFIDALRGQRNSQLILCGDLFDFWFEYRHVVGRSHFRTLARLADLIDSGVPVDYLAGNHDFWLGSFLREEVGMTVHPDALELEQAGRRLLLLHGDGLRQRDHRYRLMKRVLRHPLAVAAYRLLHPDWGIPLALFCSHLSRESQREDRYDDADYRAWACRRLETEYDLIAMGHTHVPALLAHGRGWYVNAGAWMRTFTFARIEAGVPALLQWDGQTGRPFTPAQGPGRMGREQEQ